jgi:hypothetical protein
MLIAAFTSALQANPQATHWWRAWLSRLSSATCPHALQRAFRGASHLLDLQVLVPAAVRPGCRQRCRQMSPVRLKLGKPSYRLVAGRCGVLAEIDRSCLQVRMVQEAVHERGGSADAAPVVVPQR